MLLRIALILLAALTGVFQFPLTINFHRKSLLVDVRLAGICAMQV
jgi:hypothetical protein